LRDVLTARLVRAMMAVIRDPYCRSLFAAVRVFFQIRTDTAIELIALGHELAVLKRKRPRQPLVLSIGSSGRFCEDIGLAGATRC
jgi:hypothetical protein